MTGIFTPVELETIFRHCLRSVDPEVMISHLSNPDDQLAIYLAGTPVGRSGATSNVPLQMLNSQVIVENQSRKQRRTAEDDCEEILYPIFSAPPIAIIGVGYS